jgi:hypothetical protein
VIWRFGFIQKLHCIGRVLEEHDFIIALPFWDDHTGGGPGLIAGVYDAHDR